VIGITGSGFGVTVATLCGMTEPDELDRITPTNEGDVSRFIREHPRLIKDSDGLKDGETEVTFVAFRPRPESQLPSGTA
jgi:hypothetical protein